MNMNQPINASIYWAVTDTAAMTRRGLLRYVRIPQLLVFSTIQPLMLLLLFTYVFGGAIATPGENYLDYLVPGILIQAILFGSVATGIGLAQDLSTGMTDRFHSLPMSKWALLAGKIMADTIRNVFVMLLMVAAGTILGFRFHGGFLHAMEALVLVIVLGMVFSLISATIGLAVKDPESVQPAVMVWTFPLIFASSIFVPVSTMPDFLRAFAEHSPITYTVDTVRALALGGDTTGSLWPALAWIAGLSIVFSVLAVRLYQRNT